MKIPKITFYYSEIYDQALSKQKKIVYSKNRLKRGVKFAEKLQKEWNKHARKILITMTKITGLNWKYNAIDCYVSFNTPYAFSSPLTLDIHNNLDYEIDSLVHELSHILLWSSDKVRWSGKNVALYKKYKREKYNTKIHFLVHAVVILTIKKVFEKNAEKYLKWERFWAIDPKNRFAKEYKRSWEIVQLEKPENILKGLIRKWDNKKN